MKRITEVLNEIKSSHREMFATLHADNLRIESQMRRSIPASWPQVITEMIAERGAR